MGISGIREMSTILTPPEERHPVLTSVTPYDERQIAAAIRRELLRDGQVFFVHNRVSSINKVAARIAAIRPGVPALFMSGYAQPILDTHGVPAPQYDILEKPFTEEGLLSRVRNAISRIPAPRAPAADTDATIYKP